MRGHCVAKAGARRDRHSVASAFLCVGCWGAIGVGAIRCNENDGSGPCSLPETTGCGPLCEAAVHVGFRAHNDLREKVTSVAARIIASGKHYMEKLDIWSMGITASEGERYTVPIVKHIPSQLSPSLLETTSSATGDANEHRNATTEHEQYALFAEGNMCPQTHIVVSSRTIGTTVRIGCKHGCSCPSFERCYLRYSEGICDMEVYIMVFMSVAIVAITLCFLFLIRVYLLYWEFVAEQSRDRRPELSISKNGGTPAKAASGKEIVIFDEDEGEEDAGYHEDPRCNGAGTWKPSAGAAAYVGGQMTTIPSDRLRESLCRRNLDDPPVSDTCSVDAGGQSSGSASREGHRGRPDHARRRKRAPEHGRRREVPDSANDSSGSD